jgi:hypothetical protein
MPTKAILVAAAFALSACSPPRTPIVIGGQTYYVGKWTDGLIVEGQQVRGKIATIEPHLDDVRAAAEEYLVIEGRERCRIVSVEPRMIFAGPDHAWDVEVKLDCRRTSWLGRLL